MSVLAALAALVLVTIGLRVLGYRVVIVSSGSMRPSLERGDVVVVNTTDDTLEIGDILTFVDADGDMVTHRVVDLDDGEITTMGDANERHDAPIEFPDDVIGTSVLVIPNVGSPLLSDVFKRAIIGAILLAIAGFVVLPPAAFRRPQAQLVVDFPTGISPSQKRAAQAPRRPALFLVEHLPPAAKAVGPGDSTQPR